MDGCKAESSQEDARDPTVSEAQPEDIDSMDEGEKMSFDQTEQSKAKEYEYSATDHFNLAKMAVKRPRFMDRPGHHLDAIAKIAALKISPSLVSLVSFSGDAVISQCSGTIIEIQENENVVLTSLNLIRQPTEAEIAENSLAANLKIIIHSYDECSYVGEILTYDFHYNILVVKFKSFVSLQLAKICLLDDDTGVDQSFQLRPHALKVKVGDPVVVVGRYFYRSFDLMAASGFLCMDYSEYDCRELLTTSCAITMCGDGGPLINLAGEVIGVAFFEISPDSRFLPINIAYKFWDHFKRFKEVRHPSYGFQTSNLYEANMRTLERLWKICPGISHGLRVVKVWSGSYAEVYGLREYDIIIKCNGKDVKSFLELWDIMWDSVGEVLEFEVFRDDISAIMNIRMVVGEACPNELNNWPRFDDPRQRYTIRV